MIICRDLVSSTGTVKTINVKLLEGKYKCLNNSNIKIMKAVAKDEVERGSCILPWSSSWWIELWQSSCFGHTWMSYSIFKEFGLQHYISFQKITLILSFAFTVPNTAQNYLSCIFFLLKIPALWFLCKIILFLTFSLSFPSLLSLLLYIPLITFAFSSKKHICNSEIKSNFFFTMWWLFSGK